MEVDGCPRDKGKEVFRCSNFKLSLERPLVMQLYDSVISDSTGCAEASACRSSQQM